MPYRGTAPAAFQSPAALLTYSYQPNRYHIAGHRFFTCRELIFRRNLIRVRDGLTEQKTSSHAGAIVVSNAKQAVIEDNIVNYTAVKYTNPVVMPFLHDRCGVVKELNNQTSAGKPIHATYDSTKISAPYVLRKDLFAAADDWLISF